MAPRSVQGDLSRFDRPSRSRQLTDGHRVLLNTISILAEQLAYLLPNVSFVEDHKMETFLSKGAFADYASAYGSAGGEAGKHRVKAIQHSVEHVIQAKQSATTPYTEIAASEVARALKELILNPANGIVHVLRKEMQPLVKDVAMNPHDRSIHIDVIVTAMEYLYDHLPEAFRRHADSYIGSFIRHVRAVAMRPNDVPWNVFVSDETKRQIVEDVENWSDSITLLVLSNILSHVVRLASPYQPRRIEFETTVRTVLQGMMVRVNVDETYRGKWLQFQAVVMRSFELSDVILHRIAHDTTLAYFSIPSGMAPEEGKEDDRRRKEPRRKQEQKTTKIKTATTDRQLMIDLAAELTERIVADEQFIDTWVRRADALIQEFKTMDPKDIVTRLLYICAIFMRGPFTALQIEHVLRTALIPPEKDSEDNWNRFTYMGTEVVGLAVQRAGTLPTSFSDSLAADIHAPSAATEYTFYMQTPRPSVIPTSSTSRLEQLARYAFYSSGMFVGYEPSQTVMRCRVTILRQSSQRKLVRLPVSVGVFGRFVVITDNEEDVWALSAHEYTTRYPSSGSAWREMTRSAKGGSKELSKVSLRDSIADMDVSKTVTRLKKRTLFVITNPQPRLLNAIYSPIAYSVQRKYNERGWIMVIEALPYEVTVQETQFSRYIANSLLRDVRVQFRDRYLRAQQLSVADLFYDLYDMTISALHAKLKLQRMADPIRVWYHFFETPVMSMMVTSGSVDLFRMPEVVAITGEWRWRSGKRNIDLEPSVIDVIQSVIAVVLDNLIRYASTTTNIPSRLLPRVDLLHPELPYLKACADATRINSRQSMSMPPSAAIRPILDRLKKRLDYSATLLHQTVQPLERSTMRFHAPWVIMPKEALPHRSDLPADMLPSMTAWSETPVPLSAMDKQAYADILNRFERNFKFETIKNVSANPFHVPPLPAYPESRLPRVTVPSTWAYNEYARSNAAFLHLIYEYAILELSAAIRMVDVSDEIDNKPIRQEMVNLFVSDIPIQLLVETSAPPLHLPKHVFYATHDEKEMSLLEMDRKNDPFDILFDASLAFGRFHGIEENGVPVSETLARIHAASQAVREGIAIQIGKQLEAVYAIRQGTPLPLAEVVAVGHVDIRPSKEARVESPFQFSMFPEMQDVNELANAAIDAKQAEDFTTYYDLFQQIDTVVKKSPQPIWQIQPSTDYLRREAEIASKLDDMARLRSSSSQEAKHEQPIVPSQLSAAMVAQPELNDVRFDGAVLNALSAMSSHDEAKLMERKYEIDTLLLEAQASLTAETRAEWANVIAARPEERMNEIERTLKQLPNPFANIVALSPSS